MKLQTSGVLGTSYAIAKLSPKRVASAGEMFTSINPKTIYKSKLEAQSDFKKFVIDTEKLTDSQLGELNHKDKIAKFVENYAKELNLHSEQTTELVARLRGGVQGAGKVWKVGDEIAGITISRIKAGTNGKTAIIGRAMGNAENKGVRDVYNELVSQGKNVEIFDKSSLKGKWYDDFDMAEKEMIERVKKNGNQWLDNNQLMTTEMYQLNKRWAQKLVDEGYEVIDMGDIYLKNNDYRGMSLFYSIEKATIFK